MVRISVHDAKAQLSRLIADVLAGREVVTTRRNVAVVRLVPIASRGRRQFGALKGRIAMDARFDEPLPEDELSDWQPG
ncbi:type II toxin-antitoxin system Phd/YefM family antitoxin [Novosphingobium sp.]|uniref:type II toxin-antitoxin system Phd/YefM family antitoxin n=1 Tax=Novosphingobium sp. TaxID=1874826 RepID=UPI003BA84203